MKREQKIKTLMQLYQGQISIDDLRPKDCVMKIGYRTEPYYLINGKEVSVERWNKAVEGATEVGISYGLLPNV